MVRTAAAAVAHNFLGSAPQWYKLTIVAFLVVYFFWHPTYLPRSAPVQGGGFALLGACALRLAFRSFRTKEIRGRDVGARAIVYGAGDTGRRLIKSAIREADAGIIPVAILDETKERGRLRIGIA